MILINILLLPLLFLQTFTGVIVVIVGLLYGLIASKFISKNNVILYGISLLFFCSFLLSIFSSWIPASLCSTFDGTSCQLTTFQILKNIFTMLPTQFIILIFPTTLLGTIGTISGIYFFNLINK